jgi:hypothetical protein
MDNAANNKTIMELLATKLQERDMSFDATDHQVMCFAHIIDLASGHVVRAVEDKTASEISNPIGLACTVVRSIRASGLHRDSFDEVVKNGNTKK